MIETWNTARKTAGKASERTIREDRKRLERIEAYLGDKPIGSITAQMVEQTYAAIREKHGLSGTTMNHLHTLLKNVFQKAVDYDLVPKNPCHFVTAPKREEPKRRSLSQEEGIRLLEAIDKTEMEEYEAMGEKEERRQQREERDFVGLKYHELRHTQAAQMLGNILNQGNATATLSEDPMSSKKSSGKSSAPKPEADDFSMSSKCGL